MDDIPDLESCNKCSCDFGEIICTEEICNDTSEESITNNDFDELIEYEYESIPDVTTSSSGMNKVGDGVNEILDTTYKETDTSWDIFII